jgi:hypothetical protein
MRDVRRLQLYASEAKYDKLRGRIMDMKTLSTINRFLVLLLIFSIWLTTKSNYKVLGWLIIVFVLVIQFVLDRRGPKRNTLRMSQDQIQVWEQIRIKGRRHYVFIHGLMIPLLVLAMLFIYFQFSKLIGKNELSVFELIYILAADGAMLATIYVIRNNMWELQENRYKSSVQPKSPSN